MIDIKKLKNLDYQFDENYNHICDFDLMVRLSSISKVKYLDKSLSRWRIHENNQSFKRKGLFNKEKKQWCEFHLKNKFLRHYKREINELKILITAQERIFKYKIDLNDIKKLKIKNFSNLRNFFYALFCLLPLVHKFIYELKEFMYKKKWK